MPRSRLATLSSCSVRRANPGSLARPRCIYGWMTSTPPTHELFKRGRCRRANQRTSRTDIEMPGSSIGTASRGGLVLPSDRNSREPLRGGAIELSTPHRGAWGDPAAAGEGREYSPRPSVPTAHRARRSSTPQPKPVLPDVGSGLEPCAGIDFAKPRRFAGRVTYETASIPSNATGNNDFPSAAR